MSHHILHILEKWQPDKDNGQWLLTTVVGVSGSSYRKPGAMMLFNDSGGQFGLVSGGCLESDILHQARKCWMSGETKQVTYDMQEEGEIGWKLGIGCGGEIRLLLQPVSAANDYLLLDEVWAKLRAGESVTYAQNLHGKRAQCHIGIPENDAGNYFVHTISPPLSLTILGGGPDAVPVANIAASLGWHVTVNDPRARYARPQQFPLANHTDSLEPGNMSVANWYQHSDAIIVMHHQMELDANALQTIARLPPHVLKYLALLGPTHRCEKVLHQAKLREEDLPVTLFSPAGLALGGELPESIALSMLAQAHAVLHRKSARSLKGFPCNTI